ncbi:cation diffusion facilitator family transporter [Oceanicella actignis]|uniref:cation diffusion facilitator family transporter n=1 Tax=Oceanicella actignis TaxID=1189325 RepID=UPI0011E662BD|nr:cation diffusion facilitator family transporter [Oceanicella actignis]TYO91184.1 cobalt-zinc-cadmium efflux system protein [Oceanicella actignis]
MPHDHDAGSAHASGHGHGFGHAHGPVELSARDLTPAFRWAVGLNAAYVLIEAAAGLLIGSLALLADAAHNLTDVAGLLAAWAAAELARRAPTARYTYGLGRATVLAALLNAIAIMVGVGAVSWEAVRRLGDPIDTPPAAIAIVALLGIGVNFGTALLFRRDSRSDLNARGAYLHMLADGAVSLAVTLAALGMMATGWRWLDPAAALGVGAVIAFSAFDLLRASLRLSLDGVPEGVDAQEVRAWLAAQPGVRGLHDLHIWALSATRTALTAHLVMARPPAPGFLTRIAEELRRRHGIDHVTIQIEDENEPCASARCA